MTAPRIARACQTCGREFTVAAAYLRRGPAKYCSKRCYSQALHELTLARYAEGQTVVDAAMTSAWERRHLAPDPTTGRRCQPASSTQEEMTLIGDDRGIRPYHAGLHPRHRATREAAARGGFVLAAMDVAEARGVMLAPTTREEAVR